MQPIRPIVEPAPAVTPADIANMHAMRMPNGWVFFMPHQLPDPQSDPQPGGDGPLFGVGWPDSRVLHWERTGSVFKTGIDDVRTGHWKERVDVPEFGVLYFRARVLIPSKAPDVGTVFPLLQLLGKRWNGDLAFYLRATSEGFSFQSRWGNLGRREARFLAPAGITPGVGAWVHIFLDTESGCAGVQVTRDTTWSPSMKWAGKVRVDGPGKATAMELTVGYNGLGPDGAIDRVPPDLAIANVAIRAHPPGAERGVGSESGIIPDNLAEGLE